jgi:curved DNA-binding protein CbpA
MGQLNEHPLAELIREISAAELSGALRLGRERAKAVIYFEGGQIIYAASNLRAYRLSECVSRWGILNNEQLERVQDRTSDTEFGTALVKAGLLKPEALDDLITRQVSEVVCHTLLWIDGAWEFDPRVRIAEEMRVTLKLQKLVMESARRLPVGFVASRFRNSDEKLAPAAEAAQDVALLPTEAFVLTRVDMPLSVNELLAVGGLPENETLHTVYTLALGGFLERDQWPTAFTTSDIAKARAVKSSSAPQSAKVKQQSEIKPVEQQAAKPAPVEVRDEKAELDELFERLERATNYFQVLGVVRPTKDADIKRAYHSLAKRFHPDRFRNTADSQLYARIESAFAKIAQAYDTLREQRSRAAYESTLLTQAGKQTTASTSSEPSQNRTGNPQKTDGTDFKNAASSSNTKTPSSSYNAEERFQQGLKALQSGNTAQAIVYLGEAAQLAPSQPRYRAFYGRALAGDVRMRRNAEAEFKAAITLDANNAPYRVMLAEFYIAQGFQRRAQTELEHALSIEPCNAIARSLLDKLKSGGQ